MRDLWAEVFAEKGETFAVLERLSVLRRELSVRHVRAPHVDLDAIVVPAPRRGARWDQVEMELSTWTDAKEAALEAVQRAERMLEDEKRSRGGAFL